MQANALAVLASVALLSQNLYSDLRQELVEHIDQSKSSVDLVVYEIRSEDIAEALVAAKRRAVRVRVIVDNVHEATATPQEQMLEDEGIAIKRIGGVSRDLLHSKFILFDGSIASTPSYNRSAKSLRGEGNEENAFTTDKELIRRLKDEFDNVWQNAKKDDPSED